MSSLKLPLRAHLLPAFTGAERWVILDADNCDVPINKHRAEIIVAALEADAEKELQGE